MSDSLKDTLKTLGFLDETQADRLARTIEQGGTWSDELSGFGLSDDSVEEVVELISGERVTPEVGGRYQELAELGLGGMGRVARVHDTHLKRQVALKTLRLTKPSLRLRFLREARITGQLQHPGIVPVYEIGERDDGTLYYTMKEIAGRTLKEALATAHALPERLALLDEFLDLCQAIAYAHDKGVVHRDLKPENVMLGAFGETLVVDWGLAKRVGQLDVFEDAGETLEDSSLTRMGAVMGTPRYMSPEQARGDDVDVRSDVWSLGVMLVALLSGEAVFSGTSEVVLASVRRGEVPDPRAIEPEVPAELAAICARATRPEAVDRYADAGELARDLDAWRNGALVSAHSYSGAERLARTARRFQRELLVLVAMVVALVASGLFFVPRVMNERDVARRQAELLTAQSQEASGYPAAAYATARRLADRDPVAAVMADRLSWEGADAVVHRAQGAPVQQLAWSPAGKRLAWVEGRRLVVADPDSGHRLREEELASPVSAMAFDTSLLWLSLEDGTLLRVPPTGPPRAFSVGRAFELVPSPDGTRLALLLADRVVVWSGEAEAVSVPLGARAWADVGASSVEVDRAPRARQLQWLDDAHFGVAMNRAVSLFDLDGRLVGTLASRQVVLAWDAVALPPREAEQDIRSLLDRAAARGWRPTRSDGRLRPEVRALLDELDELDQAGVLDEVRLERLLALSASWRARAGEDDQAKLALAAVDEAYARLSLRLRPPLEIEDDEGQDVFRVIVEEEMAKVTSLFSDDAVELASELVEDALLRGDAPPTLGPALRVLADLAPSAWVAVGTSADQLEVFQPWTRTRLGLMDAHSRDIWAVSIDPVERRVYTGGTDGRLRAWTTGEAFTKTDIALQGLVTQIEAVGQDTALVLTADGDRIDEWWMFGRHQREARQPVRSWTVGDQRILHAVVSPDGERIAASTDLGQLVSWHRHPLVLERQQAVSVEVEPVDPAPWAWRRERGKVVIDGQAGHTVAISVPTDADVSWSERGLVVASRGQIRIFDPWTGVVVRRLRPTPRYQVVGAGQDTLELYVPYGDAGWLVTVGLGAD